ncbi:MAG: hypothetical protein JW384_01932 [Nitrosomonadaceae bacterium]|nr:hypothetical protein [Nitrosomonadaceae bacterium]
MTLYWRMEVEVLVARVVLTWVALIVIISTALFSGRTLRLNIRWILLSIGVVASSPFAFMRDWVEVPVISKSDAISEQIWSITLQNPSQVVRRVVPRPNIGLATTVRIRVSLEGDYHGPSFLTATVRGDDFGRMFPAGAQRGLSLGHDSLELIFGSSALDGLDFVEIDLRQPVPDPALRIVVVGQSRGAELGENSAFFGDGFQWLRGVPVARTGMIVSGLPQIWLDGVY